MDVRVGFRCSRSWDGLEGDDRVRYCDTCSQNVYNLAAMEDAERDRFLARIEGRLCGRLYERSDGSFTLRECGAAREWRWAYRTISLLLALLFALLAMWGWGELRSGRGVPPGLSTVLERLGLVKRAPEEVLGAIVVPRPRPQAPLR